MSFSMNIYQTKPSYNITLILSLENKFEQNLQMIMKFPKKKALPCR